MVDHLLLCLLFRDPFFNPTSLWSNQEFTTTYPEQGRLFKWWAPPPSPEDLSPPGCALGMLCALMAQSACIDRVAQLTTLGEWFQAQCNDPCRC
jgi:hypothetical protein